MVDSSRYQRAVKCEVCLSRGESVVYTGASCPQCGTQNRNQGIVQNNTKVEMPLPRARQALFLGKRKGKQMILAFADGAAVLFWEGIPIAVHGAGIVYFNTEPGGGPRGAVNGFAGPDPLIRADARLFDFILGQVLTKAGLVLTRGDAAGWEGK